MREPPWHWILVALVLPLATPVAAQRPIDMDGEIASVLADIDGVQLIRADGPSLNPNNRTDPLRYEWFMVQDSSMGVVFTEPSGVKWNGQRSVYDGDIDLMALEGIQAIELRAVTLDVWREIGATLTMTDIQLRAQGEDFDYDPAWGSWVMTPSSYLISVLFVSRVLKLDGTTIEAPEDRVLAVVRSISEAFTLDDLAPDPLPTGEPEL